MAVMAPEQVTTEAKPAKAAVIRRLNLNQENTQARLIQRIIPAWVISGGIHVLLIGSFVLLFREGTSNGDEKKTDIVTTKVDESEIEKNEDLSNPDLGFDAELTASAEVPRVENQVVDAPNVPEEPIGAPGSETEIPTQTFAPTGIGNDALEGLKSTENQDALNKMGLGMISGPSMSTPGFRSRGAGATKDELLRRGGGNEETERAVAMGLAWLAKVQDKKNGSWTYDGTTIQSRNTVAATGMGVLPFLAAGFTHKKPEKKVEVDYTKNVALAIKYLLDHQGNDGLINVKNDGSSMYSHAIAAIAVCEAYGMTMDNNLKPKAQKAINYIISAQAKDGSWGYQRGMEGDTSIVGWQLQALKSAKLAGLTVDDKVWKRAEGFLQKVSTKGESQYGYSIKTPEVTPTRTAVGLLCRQYMGWGPRTPGLGAGIEVLKMKPPQPGEYDIYYIYYATQVMHFAEGPNWSEFWNPKMQQLFRTWQVKDGDNKGSFNPNGGSISDNCGRVGTTAMCLLTLEVYYRHLPTYKREVGAALLD